MRICRRHPPSSIPYWNLPRLQSIKFVLLGYAREKHRDSSCIFILDHRATMVRYGMYGMHRLLERETTVQRRHSGSCVRWEYLVCEVTTALFLLRSIHSNGDHCATLGFPRDSYYKRELRKVSRWAKRYTGKNYVLITGKLPAFPNPIGRNPASFPSEVG